MRLLVPVFVLIFVFSAAQAAGDVPMIDAHSHYSAEHAEAVSSADVVALLDMAGVEKIVISGTPARFAAALHAHVPTRVIPLLGVYDEKRGKADWMHDPDLPRRVAALLEKGHWAGLGELHLFARDARNPVFEQLVKLAADHDLVLLMHGDVEIIDRIFALAPDLRVVWAHLGTKPSPALLDAALARHAGRQLWIDTSVRDERIAPDGRLLPEWQALFEAHPQRFMVAVDAFSANRWQHYEAVVTHIRTWTSDLPKDLAARLLHENARCALRLDDASTC